MVGAVAIAGCFSDRGLAVEIDVGDTGATGVELYIGKQHCEGGNAAGIDCATIAPPDGTVAMRGDVWFRDDLLPYTAVVKGGTATFQLRADTASTMPVLIAVGFTPSAVGPRAVGTATLRDVAIPTDTARVATATLVAAAPVQPKQTDTKGLSEDRVMVWTKQTPPSSCVVVEHWRSGGVERDFVVPVEDPDCDDVRLECNAAAFHGTSVAGASARPDCFTSSGGSACLVASRGCSDDGGPKTGECAAQRDHVCVPKMFCSCGDVAGTCTQDLTDAPLSTVPRIDCRIPAHTAPLGIALCPGIDKATIDLGPLLHGDKCEQPLLASLQQLVGFNTSHDFGGAILELASPQPACSFTITWKSGPRTAADMVDDHGVVAVRTSEATMLVPLALHFTLGMCLTPTDEFRCTFNGDAGDSLWSCGQ